MTITRLRHVLLKAGVALCLAFLVWLYARSRHQETIDDVQIPVHVVLAAGDQTHHDVEVGGNARVLASFSGPPSRLRELRGLLHRGDVQVNCTLAVPEERAGESSYRDTVRVEPEDVAVPPGITVTLVEGRNAVPVTVHRLVERRLPVRLETVGDARISQVKIEPPTVLVRGPQEVLDQARAVVTQPYALPPAPDSAPSSESLMRGDVALVRDIDGHAIQCSPATVSFRFRLHPRQRTYELTDVPIHFLCPPSFGLRPRFVQPGEGRLTVRVVGPAQDDLPQVQAFVDLTQGPFEPGRNKEPVRFQLPRDFQPASETPRLVSFILEPASPH